MAGDDLIDRGRRSTIATLVQKVATPALTFAVTVLLARNLSRHDYGVYGLLQGAVKYVALLTSLGTPFVVQRYVPELHATGRDGRAKRLVSSALLVRAASLVVVSLALVLGYWWVGPFFKVAQYKSLFEVFLVGTALYLESGIVLHALNALFLHAYAVAGQIVYTLGKALMLVALLAIGFTLTNVVVVEVVSFGLLAAVYGGAYWWRFARGVRSEPLGEDAQRVTRYGAFSILNEVGTTVFDESTDFLIIGHFLSASALAPYYLGTQVARYFGKLNIINQFQSVFTPLFFSAYAEDERRLDKMFRFLVKLSVFLMIPGLVGFLLLGRAGLGLVFGAGYSSAYTVTAILVAFVPVSSMSLATGLVLQSLEKVDYLLYSRVFAAYNLVANIILVQRFGVTGVAIGTATAVLFKNVYCLYYAVRFGKVGLPWGSLGRLALNSAVMGVVLVMLRGFATNIPALVGIVLVAAAVFFAASYFDRVFSPDEAALIDRVAGRKVWVF